MSLGKLLTQQHKYNSNDSFYWSLYGSGPFGHQGQVLL